MDEPPPPLAFIASVFLHLIVLSLLPYAGLVAPEIVIRPARSELVLLEYRVAQGAVIAAPGQPGPASEGPFAEQSVISAKAGEGPRSDTRAEPPTAEREHAVDAGSPDIVVARFDTVIQLSPPDPPEASAIGELWDAPDFVLDWRMPRSQPGAAVLAELAALDEIDSVLARLKALPEFSARQRLELRPEPAVSLASPALAKFAPPMAVPPATLSGGVWAGGSPDLPGAASPRVMRPIDSDFALLQLAGHISGRRLAYLLPSPPLAPAEVNQTVAGDRGGPENGASSGSQTGMPDGNRQTPARPLDRRRYGIILVGPGARGQIPEANGWFSGNPVYTVYLSVPGSTRKWVLQFCRPGGGSPRMDFSNGVIRLLPRRTLDPPYARRRDPLRLEPGTGGSWARAVVFATLDNAGTLSGLKIIAGPGGESGESILSSLRGWEFLPAFEDGKPVSVEAVFSIPLN